MAKGNAATVEIRGDNKDLKSKLKESESDFTKFGKAIKKLAIAIAVAFAIDKMVSTLKNAAKFAIEAEQSLFKLERTLKAVGERAGFTSKQIVQIGKDLAATSRFSKDAAIQAATAISAFQNIKGDVFQDILKRAADLSVVFGTDLPSSARQLAAALDEPTSAIAFLDQKGIQLSMTQEIMVRRMFAVGNIMGAQRLILQKLAETYGGSAQEDLKTFEGRWAKVKNSMAAVGETIGNTLLPMIEKSIPTIEKMVAQFQRAAEFFENEIMPVIVAAWEAVLEAVVPIIESLKTTIAVFVVTVTDLWTALTDDVLPSMGITLEEVGGVVAGVLDDMNTAFIVAFTAIEVAITNWQDIVDIVLKSFTLAAITAFNTVVHFLTVTIPEALGFFIRNWKQIFETSWNFMKAVFTNMMENAKRFGGALIEFFKSGKFNFKWQGLLDGFENTVKEIPKFTKRIPSDMERSLGKDIEALGQKVGDSFNDKLKGRLKRVDKMREELFGPEDEDAEKEKEDTTPDPKKFGKFGSKQFKRFETSAGSFEGLEALNKRIQSAAVKSPQLKLLEMLHKVQFGAEATRKKQATETNKLLGKTNKNIEKLTKATVEKVIAPGSVFGA